MVQVFAIEGPDGVGKTTLIKYLKKNSVDIVYG